MTVTYLKQNDRLPAYAATLVSGPHATPIDLTGCTVHFHMRSNAAGQPIKVDIPATVVDAAAGTVRHDWGVNDLDTVGRYRVEWQITYPSGRRLTVPSNGWDEIRVVDDLA